MLRHCRRLGLAALAAFLVGCGGDFFGPRLVAGSWISAQPQAGGDFVPDTLVLDGRGGGRIHMRVYTGENQLTWVASAVRYRVDSGTISFHYCLRYGPYEGDCEPGAWQLRGHLADDGVLYIRPANPASSVGPRPWMRLPR